MKLFKKKPILTSARGLAYGIWVTSCTGIIVNTYTDGNAVGWMPILGLFAFFIISIILFSVDPNDKETKPQEITTKDNKYYTKEFHKILKKTLRQTLQKQIGRTF